MVLSVAHFGYAGVSSFIPTLIRDCTQYDIAGHKLDNLNIVIVTHGEERMHFDYGIDMHATQV